MKEQSIEIEKVENGYIFKTLLGWTLPGTRVFRTFEELIDYLRLIFDEKQREETKP